MAQVPVDRDPVTISPAIRIEVDRSADYFVGMKIDVEEVVPNLGTDRRTTVLILHADEAEQLGRALLKQARESRSMGCQRCGGEGTVAAPEDEYTNQSSLMDCPECSPVTACTYREREAFRRADDHGFGFTPPMTEADYLAREAEDKADPPCGRCDECVEANREDACVCCGVGCERCGVGR